MRAQEPALGAGRAFRCTGPYHVTSGTAYGPFPIPRGDRTNRVRVFELHYKILLNAQGERTRRASVGGAVVAQLGLFDVPQVLKADGEEATLSDGVIALAQHALRSPYEVSDSVLPVELTPEFRGSLDGWRVVVGADSTPGCTFALGGSAGGFPWLWVAIGLGAAAAAGGAALRQLRRQDEDKDECDECTCGLDAPADLVAGDHGRVLRRYGQRPQLHAGSSFKVDVYEVAPVELGAWADGCRRDAGGLAVRTKFYDVAVKVGGRPVETRPPSGKQQAATFAITSVETDADGRLPREVPIEVSHSDPDCTRTWKLPVTPACAPVLSPRLVQERFIQEYVQALRDAGLIIKPPPKQLSVQAFLDAVGEAAKDKLVSTTKEFYSSAFDRAKDRTLEWARGAVHQISSAQGDPFKRATKISSWAIGEAGKTDTGPSFAASYEQWRLQDGDIAKVVATTAAGVLKDAATSLGKAWLLDQFDSTRAGVSAEAQELHRRAAIVRSLLDVAEKIPGAKTVTTVGRVALWATEGFGGHLIDTAVKENVLRSSLENVRRYADANVANFELLLRLARELFEVQPCARPKDRPLALCRADRVALEDWATYVADLIDQWYIAAQLEVSNLLVSPLYRLFKHKGETVPTYDPRELKWGADRDGRRNARSYRGIDPWSVQEVLTVEPVAGATMARVGESGTAASEKLGPTHVRVLLTTNEYGTESVYAVGELHPLLEKAEIEGLTRNLERVRDPWQALDLTPIGIRREPPGLRPATDERGLYDQSARSRIARTQHHRTAVSEIRRWLTCFQDA